MNKHLFILLFFAFAISVRSQINPTDSEIIATVNGEPVCAGEFNLLSEKLKSKAIELTKQNSNLNFSEILRKITLDSLISIKVQQKLAKDRGLVSDISFSGFLQLFDAENNRRADASQNNKVIYGPTQYSADVYYDYLLSNLQIRLKVFLSKTDFDVSEEKLYEIYERKKETDFRVGDYIRIQHFFIKAMQAANKKKIINTLSRFRLQHIHQKNNTIINKTTLKISEEQLISDPTKYLPEDAEVNQELFQHAKEIPVGGVSNIFEMNENYSFIQVLERKSNGFRSFSSCLNHIKSSYVDSCYNTFVKNLRYKAIIVLY